MLNLPIPTSVSRNARVLRYVTYAGLGLVVVCTIYGVIGVLQGSGGATAAIQVDTGTDVAAPGWPELVVLAATGIPFALALWELSRMLGRAEKGDIFSQPTLAHLRRFALLVLVSAVLSIGLPPVLEVAVTVAAGYDLAGTTISFDGGEIFILLVNALLLFVARLFGEAQRIAGENSQIV